MEAALSIVLLSFLMIVIFGSLWLFPDKPDQPIKSLGKSGIPRSQPGSDDILRSALKAAIAEQAGLRHDRDKWRQTAEASARRVRELEAAASRPTQCGDANGPSRFRRLRALIATEFHPDHVKASGLDKTVRQEIFKALWPKVQQI